MDNSGARNRNGNPVIGWRRHNKGNQLWVPQFVGGNRFILRNPQTNRCLDNTGRAHVGRHYHIWACNARNKNQWFTIMAPNRRPVRPHLPRPHPRPFPRPVPTPRPWPNTPYTQNPNQLLYTQYHYRVRGPIPFFKPHPGKIRVEHLRN